MHSSRPFVIFVLGCLFATPSAHTIFDGMPIAVQEDTLASRASICPVIPANQPPLQCPAPPMDEEEQELYSQAQRLRSALEKAGHHPAPLASLYRYHMNDTCTVVGTRKLNKQRAIPCVAAALGIMFYRPRLALIPLLCSLVDHRMINDNQREATVWLNPRFWSSLSPAAQEAALAHELAHTTQTRSPLRFALERFIFPHIAPSGGYFNWRDEYDADTKAAHILGTQEGMVQVLDASIAACAHQLLGIQPSKCIYCAGITSVAQLKNYYALCVANSLMDHYVEQKDITREEVSPALIQQYAALVPLRYGNFLHFAARRAGHILSSSHPPHLSRIQALEKLNIPRNSPGE